jgi:cytochrome c biogenesis protein CcmG, thiol:disulfide interchange protein DsbE
VRLARWVAAALLPVLLAATAACGEDETPSPFAGCEPLAAKAATATDLPDLRLSCFTGDTEVALRDLRGPAVINLWASWCQPCRTELPVIQRLADRADGRLTVLGVDTGDSRDNGASFATDKDVTMPTLFDDKSKLLSSLGRISLPVTVFLDASGRSYTHPLPLTDADVAELVRKHTGVTVAQ